MADAEAERAQFQRETQSDFQREVPADKMEYDMQITNPSWGASKIPEALQQYMDNIVERRESEKRKLGKIDTDYKDLWQLLAYYTRDIRLGNLNQSENDYCIHYLDLAGDLLKKGYPKGFAVALSRAVTILELSQSKKGFLRRINKTMTREFKEEYVAPQKDSNFMGVPTKREF